MHVDRVIARVENGNVFEHNLIVPEGCFLVVDSHSPYVVHVNVADLAPFRDGGRTAEDDPSPKRLIGGIAVHRNAL